MKLGFFGGSFNPLTNAHINLAKEVLNKYNLDRIIFVPIGDFYEKAELIDFKHRYNMIKLVCNANKYLEVLDIENEIKTKLYAIDAFEIIGKQYINDDIYFIMGTDNLEKIREWKGYNKLVSDYKYIILERGKNEFNNIIKSNKEINKYRDNFFIVSDEKYMNISSSIVRDKIRNREEILDIVPNEIINYIRENHLYTD